jgi:hypothetical protein
MDNADRVFTYTAICGIVFVSYIMPRGFRGWANQTKITKRGTIKILQTNYDEIFGYFLGQRMNIISQLISDNNSEKQEQIINNGVLGDIENSLNSKSLGIIGQLKNR